MTQITSVIFFYENPHIEMRLFWFTQVFKAIAKPANPVNSRIQGRHLDFSTPAVSIGQARTKENQARFYPLEQKWFAMATFNAQRSNMDRDRTTQALILAAFCMMVGVGAIVSILPGRILALSGAKASLGLLSSSFALAYVAAQLPVGYLADRFGVRAFLVSGYLVCAAAGLIFFIAPRPGLIFLGRFIQGLGEAPVWALGPALLSVQYAERRGSIMGRYNAARGVSPLLK